MALKSSPGLCTIAQYLLTLFYHNFLFTNKGPRQLTHWLFWGVSGQYLSIRVHKCVTQKQEWKQKEVGSSKQQLLSMIAQCSSERDRGREHRFGSRQDPPR